VNGDGGTLDPDDFADDHVLVGVPETTSFGSAVLHGPSRGSSGAGVLFSALGELDTERLGSNRSRAYVEEVGRALGHAWDERVGAALSAQASPHTTHLCAAAPDGGLVAVTFTHGPWFGATIVPEGTGILLNGGGNLFAPTASGGGAVPNMAPLLVDMPNGVRHTVGATGGPRIPGMLLTTIVDVVHYGASLAEALAAPHVSARAADGRVEVERPLLGVVDEDEPLEIAPGDFGPSYGITRLPDAYVEAVDPRFESGLERA
jgi:gamma-glutamyltranspeptidase